MKKIPTMFLRNIDFAFRAPGQSDCVLNIWQEDCTWVRDGEGIPRRKFDGQCVMIANGHYYRRYTVALNTPPPPDFLFVEKDWAGKLIGWVPVTSGPNDTWLREAVRDGFPDDGTYEAVGPRINGGRDGFDAHQLVWHDGAQILDDVPRTFEAIRKYLETIQIEGIVFHHHDGRRAKIKRRDFGFRW